MEHTGFTDGITTVSSSFYRRFFLDFLYVFDFLKMGDYFYHEIFEHKIFGVF